MIAVQTRETLQVFDIALIDLAWGLALAALIGLVGGLVYATLTNPPPEDIDNPGEDRRE